MIEGGRLSLESSSDLNSRAPFTDQRNHRTFTENSRAGGLKKWGKGVKGILRSDTAYSSDGHL